jgi:hypothetical protein
MQEQEVSRYRNRRNRRRIKGSVGAANRQDRVSEVVDAGTGGKQVQEQAEFQEQEVLPGTGGYKVQGHEVSRVYRKRRSDFLTQKVQEQEVSRCADPGARGTQVQPGT